MGKKKAENIMIHVFQKWDMCDMQQNKKKNNDCIFPSLSVMSMMTPFLAVGLWTEDMRVHTHTQNDEFLLMIS